MCYHSKKTKIEVKIQLHLAATYTKTHTHKTHQDIFQITKKKHKKCDTETSFSSSLIFCLIYFI